MQELMERIAPFLPDAEIGLDANNMVVIYTNFKYRLGGKLGPEETTCPHCKQYQCSGLW